MPIELESLNPETGAAPASRIKDVASLNAVVKKLVELDRDSSISRLNVQEMVDGGAPFDQRVLDETGQGDRCNLNFGDGKARVKAAASGYYDLTESVPVLAMVQTELGTVDQRVYNDRVISEEFTSMLKEWKSFSGRFQQLINKFVRHGIGFNYFEDDLDWRWHVAGLDEFKLPRLYTTCEDDCDVAVVFRDVPTGKFFSTFDKVRSDDKRWNIDECRKAVVAAQDGTGILDANSWEKFQTIAKNNDAFASTTAQDVVHLAHVWVREFSGRVTQYLTLRGGGNEDFLFKCPNRFASIDQCFTFFLYEVGSNETLHSVRGLGQDIFAMVQVLNNLRCQTVDNAKLSGSLLLQPNSDIDKEELALMFYGGATYIPPNVKVQANSLANPSQGILPIIQDMTLLMRSNTGDVNSSSPVASQTDKTKFEVQAELTKESVIPTAQMDLFYHPWKRHLTEVWRRVSSRAVKSSDPGGRDVWDMRRRCVARGVPIEAIYSAKRIEPMRALGMGSPTNRLLALDEFMQYYGSLDAVGQNNLLRDRFAQKVGYSQVDRYVPRMAVGGRQPLDVEIAELQNAALSQGVLASVSVLPNDQHIIHLQQHLPSLTNDLDYMEAGQGTPQLLETVKAKLDHITAHSQLLKPDKLQGAVVAELGRQYNNAAQRVQSALEHADRNTAKQLAAAPPRTDKLVENEQLHQQKLQQLAEDHELAKRITQEKAAQRRAIDDADEAAKLRRTQARLSGRG